MNQTPQLENGYIRIANEIVEAMGKTYMSSYESQIIWTLFRKTYGYNKKDDWISNSQFVEATGIHKAHVSRTIKKLLKRKIVTQTGNKISFQKDIRLWCELPKQVTITKKLPKQDTQLPKQAPKLPKQADTIYNITKDTYTKDINIWIDLFKNVNPSYELLFKNKTQREAAKRLLSKYGVEKMTNLLNQLPAIIQRPYAPSITTPYELEAKLGKLITFLKQEKDKPIKNSFLQL